MRRNWRLAIAGLATTAVTAALATAGLAAPASADVSGTPFVSNNNSSDPHVIQCTDPSTGTNGYCLYTSQDMGQRYAYTPANYYPMRDTLVYFSPNGYNSWSYKGIAFTESQLDGWAGRHTCGPDDPKNYTNVAKAPDVNPNCRAYHLWAPSAVKMGNNYWLFVPDVSSTSDTGTSNIHNSSRIATASSTNPFGPFVYQGTVDYSSGYMSDPDFIADGNNFFLVWADGDYSNCGGFKSAKLGGDLRSILSGTTQTLTVDGLSVLGNCGGKNRPYVEGASIYKRSFNPSKPWTLIFAAKPDHVPTECTEAYSGQGVANTDNEVIAWASASSAQGPYTYEGIVMCGSTTEWTNQATITVTSNNKLVIYYHDSPATVKTRKLHAECLYHSSGVIAAVYRQPLDAANGFNDCINGVNGNFKGLWAKDPQSSTLPTVISTNGGDMSASRYQVGPWERYSLEFVSGQNAYVLRALVNNKFVCASNSTTALAPTCTSASGSALFDKETVSGTRFRLKSRTTGFYISVAGNAKLYAGATTVGDAATLDLLDSTN